MKRKSKLRVSKWVDLLLSRDNHDSHNGKKSDEDGAHCVFLIDQLDWVAVESASVFIPYE